MLKYLLLGLLAQRPRHGYELKRAFEELLGGTWMLNIGQIYTTLGRMEEEGLVTPEVVEQELLPDRKVFSITELGRKELDRWTTEVGQPAKLRDEFFFKVLVRVITGSDAEDLLWTSREALLTAIAELSRLRDDASTPQATALLLEGAVLRLEADLKWLDVCESRMGELRG